MAATGILVRSNERAFICGKTGSGKTYLMRFLTSTVNRLVVLDGKATLSPGNGWDLEPWSGRVRTQLRRGENVRTRILMPVETSDFDVFWDTVLLDLFKIGNLTIYIDELYSIQTPGNKPGPGLFACLTRGRELGIGVWAATQRPVWVPLVTLSEAEHFFNFRLSLIEDRQRMAAFMGGNVLKPIQDIHGFWYMRAEWDNPVYIRQLGGKKEAKRQITVSMLPTKNSEPKGVKNVL